MKNRYCEIFTDTRIIYERKKRGRKKEEKKEKEIRAAEKVGIDERMDESERAFQTTRYNGAYRKEPRMIGGR